MLFPVGDRGLVLAFVLSRGTKAWVDFGSARVVTYGAFFGFLNFIFVTNPVSMLYPAKQILFVIYRAFSL